MVGPFMIDTDIEDTIFSNHGHKPVYRTDLPDINSLAI
jgi:hypothetical protein